MRQHLPRQSDGGILEAKPRGVKHSLRQSRPRSRTRGPGGLPWLVMTRLTRLAVLGLCLLAAARVAAEEGVRADDLARTRLQLVDSAREYHASLERLLQLQEGSALRASDMAAKRRHLYEQGLVSRRELEDSERSAASAHAQVDDTRRRLVQADSVLAETLAAIEWARAVPKATAAVTTMVIGFQGGIDVTPAVVDDLDRFFLSRFARPLPVSARGQTQVHDRLGLDHRSAVDVAVHPDTPEGRAVIEYLQRQRVPFLAFRGVIPGTSTGAHVHVGRASARVVPVSGVSP